MTESDWQPTPSALTDDRSLLGTIEEVFREQYRRWHVGAHNANPRLPVETRALRRIGPWRVLLLLTPWMLARLFFHDGPAPLAVPADWTAAARGERDDTVIGPAVSFTLLDAPQKAHLNYHVRLGHYVMQPLALAMHQYQDADAVFSAWDEVIKTRDENMKRMQANCPLQENISRREFLCGRPKAGDDQGNDR